MKTLAAFLVFLSLHAFAQITTLPGRSGSSSSTGGGSFLPQVNGTIPGTTVTFGVGCTTAVCGAKFGATTYTFSTSPTVANATGTGSTTMLFAINSAGQRVVHHSASWTLTLGAGVVEDNATAFTSNELAVASCAVTNLNFTACTDMRYPSNNAWASTGCAAVTPTSTGFSIDSSTCGSAMRQYVKYGTCNAGAGTFTGGNNNGGASLSVTCNGTMDDDEGLITYGSGTTGILYTSNIIPASWSGTSITFNHWWMLWGTAGNGTTQIKWNIDTSCTAVGGLVTPTTYHTASVTTLAPAAGTFAGTVSSVVLDKTSCVAGGLIRVKITRDSTVANNLVDTVQAIGGEWVFQ